MVASGTQTSAIVFGNSPAATTVQQWDGSSWTAASAMANVRKAGGGGKVSSTATVAFGGDGSPESQTPQKYTEEWNTTTTARSVDTS